MVCDEQAKYRRGGGSRRRGLVGGDSCLSLLGSRQMQPFLRLPTTPTYTAHGLYGALHLVLLVLVPVLGDEGHDNLWHYIA